MATRKRPALKVMTPVPRGKRGQPTKRTLARVQRILRLLRAGNARYIAAAGGGISPDAFQDWCRVDLTFKAAVEKAESEAAIAHMRNLVKASKRNWTASAWWLERNFPDAYGRRDRVEHSGTVAHTLSAEAQGVREKLTQMAQSLAAARQEMDARRTLSPYPMLPPPIQTNGTEGVHDG